VGRQTLEVIQDEKENFEVVALSGGKNLELLRHQAKAFTPLAVALADEEKAEKLSLQLKETTVYGGEEGITEMVKSLSADIVVSCISGKAALIPTLEAIRSGKDVALANKESMVIAGDILIKEAKKRDINLIPVDSEQSAIFQCLQGHKINEVERIYLTASGGPFWNWKGNFYHILPEQALSHPRWKMGPKVSLDSANLVNKSLELIETSCFFNIEVERIKVLIHPQSLVHSLVEFMDGSILAQMGITDMRLPIHYALNYPERKKNSLPPLRLTEVGKFSFEPPDFQKFPALKLGYWAGKEGGTLPAVFNAADEIAGRAFLDNKIAFPQITYVVERVMRKHKVVSDCSLKEILEADRWAREKAHQLTEAL
jgi:1-deoxy-D-xylulose-5-phosphate reductoisomerase